MKKSFVGIVMLVVTPWVFAGSPAFVAEPTPMFANVSEEQVSELTNLNAYFLQVQSYSAKQMRIVSIDINAVMHANQLFLELFDESSITLKKQSVRELPDSSIIWKGVRSMPGVTEETFASTTSNRDVAQLAFRSMMHVTIAGSPMFQDPSTRANLQPVSMQSLTLPPRERKYEPPEIVARDAKQPAFIGIRADLFTVETAKRYRLMPLEWGGSHHVLMELKDELPHVRFIEAGDTVSEKGRKAREDYRTFVTSLGENPRDRIIAERHQELSRQLREMLDVGAGQR